MGIKWWTLLQVRNIAVFNPIDHFLAGASDDTTARVFAEVFHANLRKKNTGDAFFAGQRLLQALFQLAKSTKILPIYDGVCNSQVKAPAWALS